MSYDSNTDLDECQFRSEEDCDSEEQQRHLQAIGPLSNSREVTYEYVSKNNPDIRFQILNQHQKGLSFQVWPSSVALADYAIKQDQQFPGIYKAKKVLELGSGCGLAGLTFGALGAHVLMTDLEKVLPMLTKTVQSNQQITIRQAGNVQVGKCVWGETKIQELGQWSIPDLVIAADVIYHADLFDPLLSIIQQFPSGTVIIIAHIRRWKSDKKFFRKLRKYCIIEQIRTTGVEQDTCTSKQRQQFIKCERRGR